MTAGLPSGGPQLLGKIVLTVDEWAGRFGRSKIRLIRRRYRGLLSREVAVWVFGADHFRPIAERALIDDPCRPWHREDAGVLNRELELQSLALIARVAGKARVRSLTAAVFALAAFIPFFHGFVI